MRPFTADSLRLVPWLMNANPPGIRGNALRSFSIVMVVLSFVLVREREVVAGYTVPALERPAVVAVWLPLFLGFMLANGFAQVRSVPSMALLPAFTRKSQRASLWLLAGSIVLACVMSVFTSVGTLAAASVAAFAYGLGARGFSTRTLSLGMLWFLITLVVVLNGGAILAWAGREPWGAAILLTVGLADQFSVFRTWRSSTSLRASRAFYPHGVTPRGWLPGAARLSSADDRIRAATAYLQRCRGPRFYVRMALSLMVSLGFMLLISTGLIWLMMGEERPDGGLFKALMNSLWHTPGAGDDQIRFLQSGTLLYYALMLLPMGVVAQHQGFGRLPFSRRVLGRAAFRRCIKDGLMLTCLLTVIGLVYAGLALVVSGAPRAGRWPGMLLVLPYVLAALPWAGVTALAGHGTIPFQTGSLSRIVGHLRPLAASSAGTMIIMASLMMGAGIELRSSGGWLQYPWAWCLALALAAVGVWRMRRSFDVFYQRIPLVPEPSADLAPGSR